MIIMDVNNLLGSRECTCGRTHNCDIKAVRIGSGVLKDIGILIQKYRHILLVADQNTYGACGVLVKEQLGDKLENSQIFKCEGYLIPNEDAVAATENKLTEKTDLIMGIGSGVIQDLCKYVSYKAKLPYQIVATAPSMDGYASTGAAMIMSNMKVTYNCHVPEAIIGDTNVLRNAPTDMLRAGYGDIIGKYSCLNDWKLSALINGEYFCQEVYDVVYETANKVRGLAEGIIKRDEEAVGALMEALVVVGIAMAYIGNSRPASGSEHHFSHYFEITGILKGEPYFAHGIDVAYSAVVTAKLRKQMIASVPNRRAFNEDEWKCEIKRIYLDSADEVIRLQEKLGWYWEDNSEKVLPKWNEIKALLEEAPTASEICEMLEAVGMNYQEFVDLYGQAKINDAVSYAKDSKDRYSVLWLYYEFFR